MHPTEELSRNPPEGVKVHSSPMERRERGDAMAEVLAWKKAAVATARVAREVEDMANMVDCGFWSVGRAAGR